MSKQFWAVIAAIVVVLVGVFMLTGNKDEDKNSNSSGQTTNHVQGTSEAGVKLVEYGDFQCPYCQQYHATVKEALAAYEGKVSFQFVNFPLTSIHQNAFAASRAAEAAGKQNKYWEMHNMLYENADPSGASGWVASNSPTNFFKQFAKSIGLNAEQFDKDYASTAVNNAIQADMAAGRKLKVEATPTFYLDGKKVTIGNTVDDFKKAFDQAIAAKSKSAN
jgi:protein-disulfide isomerase